MIWESSGERAHSTLALTELCPGFASRIDLQATLSLSRSLPGFGTYLLDSITQTSISRRRTPTRLGVSSANCGLWLGTVGRRTHHSYIRVYDKGVEARCAAPGTMWRVELEAKHSHAAELCRTNYHQLTNPAFCASYSVESLKSQGCSWPFAPFSDERVDRNTGRTSSTTPTKLAAWLYRSVNPAIRRVLTVYTVGEVLLMLGISDVAMPIGGDNARPVPADDGGH